MKRLKWCLYLYLTACGALVYADNLVVTPKTTLTNEKALDQDDMCVWVHPGDPSKSTVITSDKTAGKIFVYDLAGKLLQAVDVPGKPGNIDLRHEFPLNGRKTAIVGYNERNHSAIHLYRVDVASRTLERVDAGIRTGPNYGFTLYHSRSTGKFYAFTVSEDEGFGVEQYELSDNGAGRISGRKVREWKHGKSEGCTADDETGILYVGTEAEGVWKFQAEPDQPTDGKLIAKVGEHGLTADAEGVTILKTGRDDGYLVVSSQGSNEFKVYDLRASHKFIRSFSVAGATDTDGIDICNTNLGPLFPRGLFALHNGAVEPCPVLLCDLGEIKID